jgi:hypothetical protein
MRKVTFVLSLVASVAVLARAQTTKPAELRVESNVVYGMYSGLALLMDVHYPAAANGYGIIICARNGISRAAGVRRSFSQSNSSSCHLRQLIVERWIYLVRCELSTCAPVPVSSSSRGCPVEIAQSLHRRPAVRDVLHFSGLQMVDFVRSEIGLR